MKNRIKKMNFQRQPRTIENEKSKGDKYMYQFLINKFFSVQLFVS